MCDLTMIDACPECGRLALVAAVGGDLICAYHRGVVCADGTDHQ